MSVPGTSALIPVRGTLWQHTVKFEQMDFLVQRQSLIHPDPIVVTAGRKDSRSIIENPIRQIDLDDESLDKKLK